MLTNPYLSKMILPTDIKQKSITQAVGITPLGNPAIKYWTNDKKILETHANFRPKYKTDVMIATQGKTGTTLVSHICHLIRSNGNMDYQDINDVIPYPAIAGIIGQDLNSDHEFHPRCFKSHEMISQLFGNNCKYIVTLRHPLKQTISAYDYFDKKIEISGNQLTLGNFLQQNIEKRRLFDYHIEYWKARFCSDNLLIIHYEDMIKNMEKTIKMIANFMNIQISCTQLEQYLFMTSKEFMQENINKFDDSGAVQKSINNKQCLWKNNCIPKVTTGDHHGKYIFSEKDLQVYKNAWKKFMEKESGCEQYEEYAEKCRTVNNFKWL